MSKKFKWKPTPEGGAEMKTNVLHLAVSPNDEGWACVISNSGRYSRLYDSGEVPILGDLSYAKTFCKRAACNVLRGEQDALESDD